MKRFVLLFSLILAVPMWAQNKVIVRVVDTQNVPIAGASVEAQIWSERQKPIAGQITDQNGAATFDLPSGANGKLANGSFSVAAKGFAFNNAVMKADTLEVKLEPGAIWRGKVTDEAGKAVAGAKVRVTNALKGVDWENSRRPFGEKNLALYTAQSGADGSFEIADVPVDWNLSYYVENPKFAINNGSGALAGVEKLIKMAPGGGVRGRILDLEGKPLSQILVYAAPTPRGAGGNGGKTDENGVFDIKSLTPGFYNIVVYQLEKLDFVLPRVMGVQIEVGKVADAPDMRAVKGVEVKGIVRDAATQKPLAGASIIAQEKNDTSASNTSGADGRFTLRVAPGRYKVYLSGPPEGYIRPEDQRNVLVSETELNAAEISFDLKKATVLRGTLVDEAGKPLQTKIKVDSNYSMNTFIESDAAGKWQFEPQGARPVQLGGGDDEDGYSEVISPLSIEIGTEKETTITLRKMPWQVLPGRVLTLDGKPLPGAQIEGEFYSAMGEGNGALQTSQRTAITNANGDFILPKIRDGLKAGFFKVKGKKDGFAFQKGGELSKNGPVWQVSDFIFVPLDGKIEGKTTPGARVTAAGREIVAGADGKFAFDGLPGTANQVFAFKAALFGGAKGAAAAQIELKPQGLQARDEELARDIWTDIVQSANRGTKGETYSRMSDVKMRLETGQKTFAQQVKTAAGDMAIMSLGEKWAGKTDAATLGAALSQIKDPDMRLYTLLGAATKSGDKTLAARALQEADANFQSPIKELWWREINLYRAAALAAKSVDEKAGFAALDRAVAFTLKNHGVKSTRQNGMPGQTGQGEMMAINAEVVADGGLAMLRRLQQNIEPGDGYDVMALATAIPVLAKTDLESVMPLLDELEKMPEPAPANQGEGRRGDQSPAWAFATAAAKVVPLLGAKSPEKALQLARRVGGEEYTGNRARALAGAARFQSGAEAAKLWREIVGAASSETAPRFAARAFEADEKLGREMFALALQKVEADSKNEWQSREIWANFAFYSARADAAQARFILEREWGLATQKKDENNVLGSLAFAMSAIDGTRAWQMALEIPEGNRFASFEARRKIGLYLTTSEARRRDYPIGNRDYEEIREIEAE